MPRQFNGSLALSQRLIFEVRSRIVIFMNEPVLKVYVLRHTENTPPGLVTEWLKTRPYQHEVRSLYLNEPLPNPEDVDWLIILGGGINVDQEDKVPWLRAEKDFIKHLVEKEVPCLGLCLGGQLLAEALGAQVRRHTHDEGGWWPVRFRNGKTQHFFQFHSYTFDVPEGAVHLASTDACRSQAFLYREHVLAIQFHPEATLEWIQACAKDPDYKAGPYVQTPIELLEQSAHFLPASRTWFFEMLQHMEKAAFSRRLHIANEAHAHAAAAVRLEHE